MTQEQKQLLLKDLCARLPYGVIVHATVDGGGTVLGVYKDRVFTTCEESDKHNDYPVECIKPYLRPMESMTEKETYIFRQDILNEVEARCIHSFGCGKYSLAFTEANDWLNAHHFDYRGLIEKGLALEAPEGMYNKKEK